MSKDDKPTKLEPRLRFPEFKGGLGWDIPAMSDLYGFRSTNSLSRDQLNYDSGSIYNIHYGDIHTKFQTQFRLDSERVPFIDPTVAEELGDRFHLCREGDIILADASEDLNDVGKAIELISLDAHRVVAGTHTIHATRIGDNPVIGFGGYLFKSAAVRRGIHKEAQGAKVYGISSTRIAAVRLPLPHTTAEQRKIAECLGSLDDWIAAETEALAALRRHKTGLMQQLFPRPGETRPRLRFPEFRDAGDWRDSKLGALAEIVRGGSPRPIDSFLTRDADGLNWLKIGDLVPGAKYVTGTEDRVIPEALSKTRVIEPGDLILSNSMSFGRPYLSQITTCIHDGWIAVRKIKKRVRSEFLYYAIMAPGTQAFFEDWASGGGIRNLNIDIVNSAPMWHPDTSEQDKIADCLASIDLLLASKAEKLGTLQHHKRGLMQQLFPAPDLQPGEAP